MKNFNIWYKRIISLKNSSYKFSYLDIEIRNDLLKKIGENILKFKNEIIKFNNIDVYLAKKNCLNQALIDRLVLNEKRIKDMIDAIEVVISLKPQTGKIIKTWHRNISKNSNFILRKIVVPLGVIFMIYESRPNVTIDSVALCIKSGNCVILRGGSETINTNRFLIRIINDAINNIWQKHKIKFKKDIVIFIDDPSYQLLYKILRLEKYIDLVIPRGSEKMINEIKKRSLIPVLSHGSGVCHTYVDKYADLDIAFKVCLNAKVQRPAVCNAMEKLLVHKDIALKFLPKMAQLYIDNNVELRGCFRTKKLLNKFGINIKLANESDWFKEYLDYILAIKIVDNIEEAINHINFYGSHHSDAIITKDYTSQLKFEREVDSAAIFINSSTRLHDGGVFGFGTEIGISTSKLHARGTMGLNELSTTKYIVVSNGAIRE